MKKTMLNWANMGGAKCVAVTISAVILLFTAVSPANGEILINGVDVGLQSYIIESGTPVVDTAEVSGDYLILYNAGTVGDATVSSNGTFSNYGTVIDATVIHGRFINYGGTVADATVNGGAFRLNSGSIGNLTFGDGGGSLFFLAFNGVNATGVIDLLNADEIHINLDKFEFDGDWFNFNPSELFHFTEGGHFAADYKWILTDSNRYNGYYRVELADTKTATPEPATMLIFGLGLAGLGLARRRMGNKN